MHKILMIDDDRDLCVLVQRIVRQEGVLSNSPIAGFYPWSASWLLVFGRSSALGCPEGISAAVIGIVCFLGIGASLVRFRREE